jgi:hypothetical protein
MPESTGPHGPNGTDGPDDDTTGAGDNTDTGASDNTDTGAVSRPPESFGAGGSFATDSGDADPTDAVEVETDQNAADQDAAEDERDFDETIITREASGRYEPTELTGPTGALRPADEVEPAVEEPEELLVVPINPVPVEREPLDAEPTSFDHAASDREASDREASNRAASDHDASDHDVAESSAREQYEPVAMGPVPLQPYYAEFPEQDTPPELPEEAAQRPRPERIKRAAVVGVRVVAGVVGVVVAAAVVSGAALLPLPSYTAAVPSVEVTPVETGQQLVCAGSILALSDSADTDATATTAIGDVSVNSNSSTGTVTAAALADSDSGSGGSGAAPQVLSADVDPASDEPLLLSGSQSQALANDDYFGLAASSCTSAAADSWLVGGATTTGRSTLITLTNPTEVVASVDLEVFGEIGAISAPGLTEIAVAPGSQRVLALAGFAPQLASPVVHVTATGGQVVANLQQTTVRGIEAGGVDMVGPSTAPSTTTVIPGLRIAGADALNARIGAAGFEDLVPTLRLFVPGADAVEASISVQSETDATVNSSFEIELEAGVVVDLPIDDLVDGNYTVTVESDAPVVAGARVAAVGTEADPRTDLAWLASAAELDSEAMLSTPSDVGVALHLANPTTEAAVVTVTAVTGSSVGTENAVRTVEIAPGTAAYLTADAGSSYQLSGFDALHASVTAAAGGGVAGYTVVPRPESSTAIEIYP